MKINDDIFPPNFKEIIESLDFQENGRIVITSIVYSVDDLKVYFNLYTGDDESLTQKWIVEIIGIEKEKIVRSFDAHPIIYSDHFLLYEYIDNYTELYYKGNVDDSLNLFIDLYKSHIDNYNNDLDFGFGINAPDGMLNLCRNGSGLFARGSKRILEKYENCLNSHGVKTYYLNEIECKNKNLLLLTLDNSYFIGKNFIFTQII